MMKFIYRITWFQWSLIGVFVLIVAGTAGLTFGYVSGSREREGNFSLAMKADIHTQFELGIKDFEAGNYALARQRFDYVIQQDPNYPGVIDRQTETLIRLSDSQVQSAEIPLATFTPSPTLDSRQADELFVQAENQFRNQEWKTLVQTIVALRDIDPLYRASEVDKMLFLGLRFSGIEKILDDGDLEGGLYDLALVERFAPLDSQARIYQEWARLYQIGVSFWGIFPDKAVEYFSQLFSAAPYLKDFSGIYVKDRYRMALIAYGDKLSQTGDWCLAVEQYRLAFDLLAEENLQTVITDTEELCRTGEIAPTSDPDFELTETSIVTLTPTLEGTPEITSTPEEGTVPTATPTPPSVEPTPEPTLEPAPTQSDPLPTPTPETAP